MTVETNKLKEGEVMYAVKNIKEGNYLNYAEKRKKWFGKGWKGHTVSSPFPTLRPKKHIDKCLKKWIERTFNPKNYVIVKFVEKEFKEGAKSND